MSRLEGREYAFVSAALTQCVQCLVIGDAEISGPTDVTEEGMFRADADFDIESLLEACEGWLRSLPRGRRYAAA